MKPGTAAFLSFLLSGVGQIYNGQIRKGTVYILLAFAGMVGLVIGILLIYKGLLARAAGGDHFIPLSRGVILSAVCGFLLCANGLLSILDAYRVARNNAARR
jgi:hypothetical protein